MKFLAAIFSLIMISFSACTSTRAQSDGNYPVILNFISIGTGVPDAQPVEDFVKNFKTTQGIASIKALKTGPLGKEGEYELAFPLTELNGAQQKSFVAGLSEVAKNIRHNGGSVAVTLNAKEGSYGRNERATTDSIIY